MKGLFCAAVFLCLLTLNVSARSRFFRGEFNNRRSHNCYQVTCPTPEDDRRLCLCGEICNFTVYYYLDKNGVRQERTLRTGNCIEDCYREPCGNDINSKVKCGCREKCVPTTFIEAKTKRSVIKNICKAVPAV